MSQNLVRTISKSGGAVVCAIDSTAIVRKMEQLHTTAATASAALGRLLTGAALMGSFQKGEGETVSLKLNGGGPIGTVYAICDANGNVRGYCDNPLADLPLNPANGKLDVGGIVGTDGTLTVIRDKAMREPYIGQIAIATGEIAEDITAYFAKSEQVPTACALGVLVNPDLTIRAAGGYMLQLLPDAGEQEIALIEQNIAKLDAVTTMLSRGMSPTEIAFAVLDGFEPVLLEKSEVKYQCNCSRDRMCRVLKGLGSAELETLATEQAETEIVCSYCNSKYLFSDAQLLELVAESGGAPVNGAGD